MGNPGSGKSTICNLLTEELKSQYKVMDLGEYITKAGKIYYLLYLCLTNPILSISLIRDITRTKQPNKKNLLKMIINMLYITGFIKMIKKKQYDFIIMDQAIFQGIWSIEIEAQESFKTSNLSKLLPNSYNLIYVEVDDNRVIERLSKRTTNDSRFEKNSNTMDLTRSNKLLNKLYTGFYGPKILYNNDEKIDTAKLLNVLKSKEIV